VLGHAGEPEDYPWGDVRFELARGVAGKLAETGLSPASINKSLVALRGVLETAWRQGELPDEEYRRIVIKNVKGKRLPAGHALDESDLSEMSHALDKASLRDAALIVVLYGCGLRRVEAARLQRSDYDIKSKKLRVIGKGDKERLVPVAPDWRALFERHWKTLAPGESLFSLSRNGISYAIESFCKKADIPRFTPHDLRRSFATHVIEGGGDLMSLQRLMGHESLDTTRIYDRRGDAADVKTVSVLKRPK
jgi:site-specific recombinase XerD